jgi:signal transduction histidine kinase
MINQSLDFKDYTLLIIDDNPTNLEVLVKYLENTGFEIVIARNGEMGLKRAKVVQPDLILLDVMMPGMSGFETCKHLKAEESTVNIPVIFMTALDSTQDKVKGFGMGGVDYVTKPIQQEEALARITTHLKLRNLTKNLNAKIEELTEARHELVQSEKMASLGRLVAGFAHELNTPIGVAVGAASTLFEDVKTINQLLEQDEVQEKELVSVLGSIKETVDLTLSNLKRASNLINSFKRTAVDQSSEEKRRFNIKTTIFDVINTLHNQLKRTAIEIKVDCPNDFDIYGIPGALEQIITNFIMNSLIHGDNNANKIKIVVTRLGDKLHLEYSDTGKGITPENLKKIFEPFFTTHRAHGGSGLGLYICYNIVENQLHGTMTCKSSPGNGVLFTIDFPVEA